MVTHINLPQVGPPKGSTGTGLSPSQQSFVDHQAEAMKNGGSGGGGASGSGNTDGQVTMGPVIQGKSIQTEGKHQGKNLQSTDPEWRAHIHDTLSGLGQIPVFGAFFDTINGVVYAAEGNVGGAIDAFSNVAIGAIPGGSTVKSAEKIEANVVKAAEKTAFKTSEKQAVKTSQALEKQGDKAASKAEKQAEKQSEKEGEKDAQKSKEEHKDGGQVEKGKEKQCKGNQGAGNPVNPLTGVKFLTGEEDLDFQLASALPLGWQRSYFSDLESAGWLGQGWTLPLSVCLKNVRGELTIVDSQGNEVPLPMLETGDSTTLQAMKTRFSRETNARYRLAGVDGNMQHVFARLSDESDLYPLVGIADRHGNQIRIAYDDAGFPVTILDAAARVLLLEHAAVSLADGSVVTRLHRVVLDGRALVSYEYSDAGDLCRVRDSESRITREFAYRNHILIEHGQPGALVARYEYDEYTPKGKVQSIRNNVGQSWHFRYLADRTELTDPLGHTELYRFNAERVLVEHVNAAGAVTRSDVDGKGGTVMLSDASGHTQLTTYDGWGNTTSTTDAAGHRMETIYDPRWHRPTLVTSKTGDTTRYEYDATGNLISSTDALGHRTEQVFDEAGRLMRIVDAHGGEQRFEHDEHGLLASHTDCSGRTTSFTWDENAYLRSVTNAASETTRHWHDAKGRLLKTHYPDDSIECYSYDAHGRLTEHVNPQGARTIWEPTADGLPAVRIDALGNRQHYEYDAARQLRILTNENGAQHRFEYDAVGNLIEEIGFDGRIVRHTYDVLGQESERFELGVPAPDDSFADTVHTRFERDATGLLTCATSERARDGRIEQTHWRYDAAGRLIDASNACSRIERSYDARGQLVSETTHVLDQTFRLEYEHDALGNHIRTTLPDGRQINYLYYGSGHLHQINIDGDVISDIDRDELHREVCRTQGRLTTYFEYDCRGRRVAQRAVKSNAQTPFISRRYDYDRAGNVCCVLDHAGNTRRYAYDALGRLLQADEERFSYDPANNILDGSTGPILNNRIERFGDKHYKYDAHGNVVEKNVDGRMRMRFDYCTRHRIERAHVQSVSDEESIEYGYDVLGRRVFKKHATGTTLFLWEFNRLLGEVEDSRSFIYVYEPNSFVPLAQIERAHRAVDTPIKRSTLHYFHTDQVGTPRELTAADGSVEWRAEYHALGKTSKGEFDDSAHQPLRFQGQYFDSETGLHYNHQRYFDPDTGRYITQDPLGIRGGINLYQYGQNPLNWIDPLGLQGVNLNIAGPINNAWAATLPEHPNFFTVLSHGNPNGITGNTAGDYISASELSQQIRNTPGYHENQTIVLIACHAGAERNLADPHNSSFGQELSDEMRQVVMAPDGMVSAGHSGGVGFVSTGPGVQWHTFTPEPYVLTHL